jgi:hypothetical protein
METYAHVMMVSLKTIQLSPARLVMLAALPVMGTQQINA